MNTRGRYSLYLLLAVLGWAAFGDINHARAQTVGADAPTKPSETRIANGSMPVRILVQSPADTDAELQIICLFRSDPSNTLHGSLIEVNEKLKGLLDQIRKPTLFRGDFGETIVIVPAAGGLGAKKLLIVGLGDSEAFTPQRMEAVGAIVYRESNRLSIAHPFFAPTILDGGVSKFATGDVAEQFMTGFLRAARTEKILQAAGEAAKPAIAEVTFLAGAAHASDTQRGIEKAIAVDTTP